MTQYIKLIALSNEFLKRYISTKNYLTAYVIREKIHRSKMEIFKIKADAFEVFPYIVLALISYLKY